VDDNQDGDTIKVTKLAGPGVRGLEYDPPVFHFDLPTERIAELLSEPVAFLARLGLGPEQGVAPAGAMTVRLTSPKWAWNGRNWILRESVAADNAGAPNAGDAGTVSSSCCYISGPDEMTCHTHTGSHFNLVFVND
jgi:hypothetical protein